MTAHIGKMTFSRGNAKPDGDTLSIGIMLACGREGKARNGGRSMWESSPNVQKYGGYACRNVSARRSESGYAFSATE